MIDTIKIKIPLTPLILLAIQKKSFKELTEPGRGVKMFSNLVLNPDGGNLIVVKDFDHPFRKKNFPSNPNMVFYLEGSLPKIVYGENVHLLYPSQLPSLFKNIEKALNVQYGAVPSWENWEIQRVDAVYAWKIDDQQKMLRMLEFLGSLEYPRKKGKLSYEGESVTFVGRAYSIKFYSKEPEFIKHGYRELKYKGSDELAENALQLSQGVIRYEAKFHRCIK